LIQDAAGLLEPGGILIFSSNLRRFRLEREALEGLGGLAIQNITAATLPKDFARNPRMHNVWRIERRP
jgi:23S rRNA (guanine2445-N2)-methyltransferase / 23S rRNA (guanine2069-N7)-methyltransferase